MAIVFGHEIHILIPKLGTNSHFYSLSAYWGEGGGAGLRTISKKKVLLVLPKIVRHLLFLGRWGGGVKREESGC